MMNRRNFLKALGIGAAAIAAPVVGRRIWQVGRNAPERAARLYVAVGQDGSIQSSADGVMWQDTPLGDAVVHAVEPVIHKGALVALDENGELKPAEAGDTIVGRYDVDWMADLPNMREWLKPRVHFDGVIVMGNPVGGAEWRS